MKNIYESTTLRFNVCRTALDNGFITGNIFNRLSSQEYLLMSGRTVF